MTRKTETRKSAASAASAAAVNGCTEAAPCPSFAEFAMQVYPFLELQPFHLTYYRLLEEFARGRIR